MHRSSYFALCAIMALGCCSAKLPIDHESRTSEKKMPSGACRLEGAWLIRNYYADIISGTAPEQAFHNAVPYSALFISESCESLIVVNNFHDREFCRLEPRRGNEWSIFNFYTNQVMGLLQLAEGDNVLNMIREKGEYLFIKYPPEYSEHKLPADFVNDWTIAGRYEILHPDSGRVEFCANGNLMGLENYSCYLVGFDFVLDHCDYLILQNDTGSNRETYQWSFKGDTLRLWKGVSADCDAALRRNAAYIFLRNDALW